ncbi:MAG: HAD-IA family hydrolase [Candidatus Omnitrophica bacterium]|nr:HAD-IA family hydrolase [Candidatus Omnitrophota bacterium]
MKQLLLYDLDGTLVDTLQDITEAANHMRQRVGLTPKPAEEVRRYIGGGVQELVRQCLETEDAAAIDDGVEIYRAYYTRHLLDHSRLYPNAQQMLEYFKDRRQAVITNKPNPYSTQILEGLGVAKYFRDIIGGNSGYPKKPDPAALMAVLSHQAVPSMDAVFIGDSPIDVETGRRAGVLTAMVLHGFSDEAELREAAPDLLVKDFEELLAQAQRQRW